MVKTIKYGVMYHGKVQREGALLSLPADAEARLVKEGWCSYVESWPAGKSQEEPETSAPVQEEPAAPNADDAPKTDLPEEDAPKKTTRTARTRKK